MRIWCAAFAQLNVVLALTTKCCVHGRMLGSEAVSATTWCHQFGMGITPNVDDIVSGRPGRSGNWAASLGGPKAGRIPVLATSPQRRRFCDDFVVTRHQDQYPLVSF